MTHLLKQFQEAKKISNEQSFTNISVRTPIETTSMIETLSLVSKSPIMAMFTSDLSEYLAEYLLQDDRNKKIIEEALNKEYMKISNKGNAIKREDKLREIFDGSSVEILIKNNVLNISNTSIKSRKLSTRKSP